jgi:coproporphyrinogen III oxidase-like Fe-S oxidoreductase
LAVRVLGPLLEDGLVRIERNTLVVPPAGRPFLRNAAVFFDEYFQRAETTGPVYSRSV